MKQKSKKLGDILIESGDITPEQLNTAIAQQEGRDTPLGEIMIELGYIQEKQLMKALEYQLGVPYVDFSEISIQREATATINESMAKKYAVVPISKQGNELTLAMIDPLNYDAIDDVKMVTGLKVIPRLATKTDIHRAIERNYGGEGTEKAIEDLKKERVQSDQGGLAEETESEVSQAPAVRLVNSVIQHAIRLGASDIHIEPSNEAIVMRFRVDGELVEVMRSAMSSHSAIITRIKIIGRMDIAEKRVPQDGRVEMQLDGRTVDLRISILPTIYGEKVVIRILGMNAESLTRARLGLTDENSVLFDKLIKSPHGIILVSGPTGSGKTTTLYTVLKELNKPTTNIITVEDPVEIKLKGINQVQVNAKAGLTFANGLRSILRQDPDIIMIGEIRDSETAQIAIRASISGHLVLSTIHTNDAVSSVSRLVDMGIEPYLVSTSVVGVVAQRLVRRICPKCKVSYRPSYSEMLLLKLSEPQPIYKGEGCAACGHTGFSGRCAIHEILVVNREVREMIDRRAPLDQIRTLAARFGTTTLRENCIKLVMSGATTMSELVKVTYSVD